MDADALTDYITTTFPNVETTYAMGYTFFFVAPNRKLPFATIGTEDNEYDSVSNLSRPPVFRLNIGVSKKTYQSMFGAQRVALGPSGMIETGHDFAALDLIMPHPTYAPQSWVCVLNPGESTLPRVRALLEEAYELAAKRERRKPTS
jgi:hypothetical protein